MLPTSCPCQQPYYQSIMNLDDPCDANRMATLTEYKLKNLYASVATKYVCACDCMCVCVSHACTPMSPAAGNLRKAPDPESSTRNVRHYPVELSTPPFISIKICNNACTLC